MRNNKPRSRFFIFFLIVLFHTEVMAQPVGFIHIQNENNLSFQVRWNGNNFPSSPSGYLVIPQVPAGTHQLFLTFPPDLTSEFAFSIIVTDKPRGFSLRLGIDNGWTLFDMIDFSLLKGTSVVKVPQTEVIANIIEPITPPDTILKVKETISQTDTIAKQKLSISQPLSEKKAVVVLPKAAAEIPIVLIKQSVNNKSSSAKSSSIQKIFDKTGSTGIDQVFIVVNDGKADTVAIFIPDLKEILPKVSEPNQIAYHTNPLLFPAKSSFFLEYNREALNVWLIKSLLSK